MEEKKHNVLLIDDEYEIRTVLGDFLGFAGFNYKALPDGLQAHDILQKEKFDILISDIIMPGKSGLEVIKESKATNPELIIIALTGGARASLNYMDNEAIEVGADKCLYKPFSGLKMIEIINDLIAQRN